MCRKYQFVTFVTCNFCNFCNAVRCIINLSSNNLTYNQKFTSFFCSFQKKNCTFATYFNQIDRTTPLNQPIMKKNKEPNHINIDCGSETGKTCPPKRSQL